MSRNPQPESAGLQPQQRFNTPSPIFQNFGLLDRGHPPPREISDCFDMGHPRRVEIRDNRQVFTCDICRVVFELLADGE